MKSKKIELDVDFIGGQGSLTQAEEKSLSEFLKQRKITTKLAITSKKFRKVKRTKVSA